MSDSIRSGFGGSKYLNFLMHFLEGKEAFDNRLRALTCSAGRRLQRPYGKAVLL